MSECCSHSAAALPELGWWAISEDTQSPGFLPHLSVSNRNLLTPPAMLRAAGQDVLPKAAEPGDGKNQQIISSVNPPQQQQKNTPEKRIYLYSWNSSSCANSPHVWIFSNSNISGLKLLLYNSLLVSKANFNSSCHSVNTFPLVSLDTAKLIHRQNDIAFFSLHCLCNIKSTESFLKTALKTRTLCSHH